ncbi:MAG: metal-dependent transcriptional regulator [Nitrososphaerota archaeon]|nr:metal-dependent transcriptional regulator [Nitrososphaerota archaeon]
MRPVLSRRDYDCLETVHDLSSEGWPARVKDIAGRMKVQPPTAVGFLDKLSGEGLVEKGPSGYRLSKDGSSCYNEATRTHRLLETLFSRNGVPLEAACRISSSIGRSIDETDLERLCANMSHPETCPHGRPIPRGKAHV